MTYIPGIEGLHSWTPPGAIEPAVTIGEGVYKLRGISGLGSLGDPEENAAAIVGGIGENLYPDDRRGKTVAYEGRIDADSLLELREAEATLRAAFANRRGLGRMDLVAHPDNVELAGQSPKFFEAQAMNCDIADQQATKRWSRNFVIGVRLGDPRIFEGADAATADLVDVNEVVEFSE